MEKAGYDFFYRLIACGIILCISAGLKYTGHMGPKEAVFKEIISKSIELSPKKAASPAKGSVTAEFGGEHKGIDIANSEGTAIHTVEAGEVLESAENDSYGKYVKISHKGFTTLYAHCRKLLVKTGDLVSKNQQIAEMGSTGDSTGPHLHFEIIKDGKYINPESLVNIP